MTDVVSPTTAGELGTLVATAVRDLAVRATESAPIATYVEGPSPLAWEAIADGGWDQVGIADDGDDDGASLRDLVEIALSWGEYLIPLPLSLTILARRHSAAAREWDGPLTIALPLATLPAGRAFVPFAGLPGVRLVEDPGGTGDRLADAPDGERETLGLAMQGVEAFADTTMPPPIAREIAVMLAAECVGSARRLLADGVAYVKQREQFGKPIGTFQAVKHHLANALIAVEMAESAVIWASEDPGAGGRVVTHAVDQSIRAAELVIQVHGGLGFTWEMGLHFPLRHMMIVRETIPGLMLGGARS